MNEILVGAGQAIAVIVAIVLLWRVLLKAWPWQ